jgi:alpha-L-fucosidase
LIKDLVDAVSRGGNFLLNIGPEPSGHIPEPMSQRLLEIGQWIDHVNASIFDSVPYWITSSEDDLRFTAHTNGKSVYVFSFQELQQDSNEITIKTPLPIQKGSIVTLMNQPQIKVEWFTNRRGGITLKFNVTEQDRANMLIPVFEISMPFL